MNDPFHICFYFRVSKMTGIIDTVVYVPAIEAVDTASTMFIVADEFMLHDYKQLAESGAVGINAIIPGTFTKKK
ncbi:hypothetical protein ACFPU0_13250 [Pseudomonas sp. GCM10022186]|uniref:hypothetical protein n=1 Tax=Pseudomonas sp. GCM10022186 TaxID=3252650 RepID=UPI00360D4B63